MNQLRSSESLPVELYTGDEILSGHISCPDSLRLLDILNTAKEFCTFDGFYKPSDEGNHSEANCLCIRKSAINFMTADDVNLGRGAGAKTEQKTYPVVRKSSVRVTLRLQNYMIIGNIHCTKGQTIQDLMNYETVFLPLTDVDIIREQHLHGTKPFVAVNKQQIIWSQAEQYP